MAKEKCKALEVKLLQEGRVVVVVVVVGVVVVVVVVVGVVVVGGASCKSRSGLI
jgi:hypothetical protein